MNRALLLGGVAALALGAGAVVGITHDARQEPPPPPAGRPGVAWVPPRAAGKYLGACRAAAIRRGLPLDLITRMAQQESGFRPDVISGKVKSSAGAVGLMQIIPRWHPNVDPLDPFASINYAAKWVDELRDEFGYLYLALAAYNWGPAVLRQRGWKHAPAETRNYVRDILRDVAPQELPA